MNFYLNFFLVNEIIKINHQSSFPVLNDFRFIYKFYLLFASSFENRVIFHLHFCCEECGANFKVLVFFFIIE